MPGTDYLIAISLMDNNFQAGIRLHKLMELRFLMGVSRNGIDINLYVLPAFEKSVVEMKEQVKAISGVKDFSYIALSNPIRNNELNEVRTMLKNFWMDAESLPYEDLDKYLTTSLAGESTYYLEIQNSRDENALSKVRLKPVSDLIRDNPVHDSNTEENISEATEIIEGLVVRNITIGKTVMVETPPPPSDPPADLSQMSDSQIREWFKKVDHRKLEDKNIEVKRTATEIRITIDYKGATENFGYFIR